MADLSTRQKPSTLERRVAAISDKHEAAGFAPLTSGAVRDVISAVRRKSPAKARRMAALGPGDLGLVVDQLRRTGTVRGIRDAAVMLLGFSSALRRSEICGFGVADIDVRPDRLELTISQSKTDQDARGDGWWCRGLAILSFAMCVR